MQAALKSIRSTKDDPYARRDFVRTIRYLFQKQRADRGTQIRGRDYVARVRAHEATQNSEGGAGA